jgi:KUP system potassium uptake protein
MEQPDLPAPLERAEGKGFPVDASTASYFIGHDQVVARRYRKGLARLVVSLFAFMKRNSSEVIEYSHLLRDRVVEIGRQSAI